MYQTKGSLVVGSLLVEAQQLALDAADSWHCLPTKAAGGQWGYQMGRQGAVCWGLEAAATFCTWDMWCEWPATDLYSPDGSDGDSLAAAVSSPLSRSHPSKQHKKALHTPCMQKTIVALTVM